MNYKFFYRISELIEIEMNEIRIEIIYLHKSLLDEKTKSTVIQNGKIKLDIFIE